MLWGGGVCCGACHVPHLLAHLHWGRGYNRHFHRDDSGSTCHARNRLDLSFYALHWAPCLCETPSCLFAAVSGRYALKRWGVLTVEVDEAR